MFDNIQLVRSPVVQVEMILVAVFDYSLQLSSNSLDVQIVLLKLNLFVDLLEFSGF